MIQLDARFGISEPGVLNIQEKHTLSDVLSILLSTMDAPLGSKLHLTCRSDWLYSLSYEKMMASPMSSPAKDKNNEWLYFIV